MTDYKPKLIVDWFLSGKPNSTLAANPGKLNPYTFSHTQHWIGSHLKYSVFQTAFPSHLVSLRTNAGFSDFGGLFTTDFVLSRTIFKNHTLNPVLAFRKCIHYHRDYIQNLLDQFTAQFNSQAKRREVLDRIQSKSIHNKFKVTLSSLHLDPLKAQSTMQISMHHTPKNQSHKVICRQPVFTSTRPITF